MENEKLEVLKNQSMYLSDKLINIYFMNEDLDFENFNLFIENPDKFELDFVESQLYNHLVSQDKLKKLIEKQQKEIKEQEGKITEEYTSIDNEVQKLQRAYESEKVKNDRLAKDPVRNERALSRSNEILDRLSGSITDKNLIKNQLTDKLDSLSVRKNKCKTQIQKYNNDGKKVEYVSKQIAEKYETELATVDNSTIRDTLTNGTELAEVKKVSFIDKFKGLFNRNKDAKNIRKNVSKEVNKEYDEIEQNNIKMEKLKEELLKKYNDLSKNLSDKEEQKQEKLNYYKKSIDDLFNNLDEKEKERQASLRDPGVLDGDEINELINEAVNDVKEEQRYNEKKAADYKKSIDDLFTKSDEKEEKTRKGIVKDIIKETKKAAAVGTLVGGTAAMVYNGENIIESEAGSKTIYENNATSLQKDETKIDLGNKVDEFLDGETSNIKINLDDEMEKNKTSESKESNKEIPSAIEVTLKDGKITEIKEVETAKNVVKDNSIQSEEINTAETVESANKKTLETNVDPATQANILDMIKNIGSGTDSIDNNIGSALLLKLTYDSDDLLNSLSNALTEGSLSQSDMDKFVLAAQKEGWNVDTVCSMLGISEDYVKTFTGKDISEYKPVEKENVKQESEKETTTEKGNVKQESEKETTTEKGAAEQETIQEETTTEKETVEQESIQEETTTEKETVEQESIEEETTTEKETVEQESIEETTEKENVKQESISSEKQVIINDVIEAYSKDEITADGVKEVVKKYNIQKSDFSEEQKQKVFGIIIQKEGLDGISSVQKIFSDYNEVDELGR